MEETRENLDNIIQISAYSTGVSGALESIVVALCLDGSVWRKGCEKNWTCINQPTKVTPHEAD